MVIALIAILSAAGVLVFTGVVRSYSIKKNVMDVPNSRSSHSVPTPRGGGIAIVIGYLSGLLALVGAGQLGGAVALGIGGAGGLVALIGYLDDHREVPAGIRLGVHFLAASWGLFWLGGLPEFVWGGGVVKPGFILNLLALLALVWFLNLYNFMDGIDGIASVEAITTLLGFLALGAIMSFTNNVTPVWLLVACVFGFLFWNLPPARIFMGDAGSGFVGLVIGLLVIYTARDNALTLWCWAILLAVFWLDASLTLIRRIIRGEKPLEAHRSHAYQIAARKLGGHGLVTFAVGGINLAWLLPLATLTAMGYLSVVNGMLLATFPLLFLALYLGAGTKNE